MSAVNRIQASGDVRRPPVCFFISYTQARVGSRRSAVFIESLKSAIRLAGDRYIDAFDVNGPDDKIHQTVERFVAEADAVLADVSGWAPNVFYECGAAMGMGKPVVYFIDKFWRGEAGRNDRDDERSDRFRRMLLETPLPSDAGDQRYHEFDLGEDEVPSDADRERSRKWLTNVLEGFAKSKQLGQSAIGMRSTHGEHTRAFVNASRIAAGSDLRSVVIQGCIKGSTAILAGALAHRVTIDESNYPFVIKVLASSRLRDSTKCISDLSAGIDQFLHKSNPSDVRIGARIFAFDPDAMLDLRIVSDLESIRRHARHYRCLVVDRVAALRTMRSLSAAVHANAPVSCDLLVAPGGMMHYSRRGGDIGGAYDLEVLFDEESVRTASVLWSALESISVDVSECTGDAPDGFDGRQFACRIREEWIARRWIGKWEPAWNNGRTRDPWYYADYECHIRAWIDVYEALVARFVQKVVDCVDELEVPDSVVVEIGPGAGEVTEILLQRLSELARGGQPMVRRYVLCERELAMLRRVAERGLIRDLPNSGFERKPFRTSITVVPKNATFTMDLADSELGDASVIVGSLVHHYIDALNVPEPSATRLFEEVQRVAPKCKAIVLAGVFFAGDQQHSIDEWRGQMLSVGVPNMWVANFFDGNPHMQRRFMVADFKDAGQRLGWDVNFARPAAGDQALSPFAVMVARRRG